MIDLKYSVHQINTVTGDLEGNTQQILDGIVEDEKNSTQISIFPEMSISGYMCGSLFDRPDFIKNQMEKLNVIHDKYKSLNMSTIVILGFARMEGLKRNGFPELYNSVAVIDKNGIRTYDKQILADSDHHEDKKYFQEGKETKVFEVDIPFYGKTIIGTPLCEDAWFSSHKRNIPQQMIKLGAQILIIPNQSYFYYGKQKERIEQFSKVAKYNNVPVIAVNSVAVGDILKNILIYDGGSMVFNSDGYLLAEFERFENTTNRFRLDELSPIAPKPTSKYKEITNALIYGQKELFTQSGITRAQIHMSGGLDSSIVGALVFKSMGRDNIEFISNPSSLNTKSKEYVQYMDDKLGTKTWWHPIQEIIDTMDKVDDKYMVANGGSPLSDTARASNHAVLRTVLAISDSHRFKTGIVSATNETELMTNHLSYLDVTFAGVCALIGSLTKSELFELAAYINDYLYEDEIIHRDLYTECETAFPAAAELPDCGVDDFLYHLQSGICASLLRERKTKADLVFEYKNHLLDPDYFQNMDEVYKYDLSRWISEVDFAINKMRISVYKAAQAPPVMIISPRTRGFSSRETLINKYRG